MRALAATTYQRLAYGAGRAGTAAVLGGAVCAVLAVALYTELVATFGLPFGVRLGLTLASIAGIGWGRSQFQREARLSARHLWLYLTAILLLWPTWMAFQLETVAALPLSVWSSDWSAELIGVLFGLMSGIVPIAVGTQWLLYCAELVNTASWIPESSGSDPAKTGTAGAAACSGGSRLPLVLTGFAAGLLFMAVVATPVAGIWWPLWSTVALVACAIAVAPLMGTTICRGARTAVVSDSPAVSRRAALPLAAIAAVAGYQMLVGVSLITEISPSTLPLEAMTFSLLLLAWAAGGWCRRFRKISPVGEASNVPVSLLQGWLAVSLLQLLMASQLIDLSFWLSTRVLNPLLLESLRGLLIAGLVGPLAGWLGWAFAGTRSQRWLPISLLAGGLVALFAVTLVGDSLILLWSGLTIVSGIWLCRQARLFFSTPQWQRGWRAWLMPSGLMTMLLLMTAILPWTWPTERAVKLLFSTPALLGARSGWPAELLPELDDSHLMDRVAGREGDWTLWRSRGSDLVFRRNGIPQGALTTHPEWSPQYAPEVASTLWPLALVDQPARVLQLGAGSTAALQTALAFPISEIVCCESDPGLMELLQRAVVRDGSVNPLADDRCRTLLQPTGWLALPDSEQFDVIVSTPVTAVLPSASTEMTIEFYRRSARHLSERGVFCQRISAVDFGPKLLLSAATSLQQAFKTIACLEVGPGEYLLLGAHDPAALVRSDLPARLEMPHVAHLLSRCNWDWSLPLNLPAYDGAALREAASEIGAGPQSIANAWLPGFTPRELLRWGPKLQETAAVLMRPRTTPAEFPLPQEAGAPRKLEIAGVRKSRYLEWLGPTAEDPALLRRLSESATQQQLVLKFPDTHWWEYRKELRGQLQDHPRSGLQQVSHLSSENGKRWHPEDRRRKAYFEALGEATQTDRPTLAQLQAIEQQLEPYDPLMSYFAHQEVADLYARSGMNPLLESAHRLHVIYYAPRGEASVRNVTAAIDHLVKHPEATGSDTERFEILNGLLQTLRSRWEVRNTRPPKSVRVTQQEIERSLLAVERALETMTPLAAAAGWSDSAWKTRQLVLDRILARPFRTYRDQLAAHARESERRTRELLNKATNPDEEAAPSAAPAMNGVMAH